MAYHILALLAEIGGLGSGAFALMGFFCTDVTFMLVINKFVQLFYSNEDGIYRLDSDKLVPTEDQVRTDQTIGKEFSLAEMLYQIWWLQPFLCCFKFARCMRNAEQFDNYYRLIIHEMNFFKVYSKIKKIEKNQFNLT